MIHLLDGLMSNHIMEVTIIEIYFQILIKLLKNTIQFINRKEPLFSKMDSVKTIKIYRSLKSYINQWA